MLDRHIVPRLRQPLARLAMRAEARGITANQITMAGFLVGMLSVPAIAFGMSLPALLLLALNRLADGIDGELARRQGATDAGAFLDITLDFIFYAAFPLGFAFMNPAANALPAAVLVASFMGTGASFLAFALKAEQRGIEHPDFGYKGFYYLDGLAEGSETILCFALMCLFPAAFAWLAWGFAAICVLTAINRLVGGFRALR
ncbi:MAG: hypothetical protein CSB44_04825 [Gammaproteobacteria bacterium]|nr:MAG: hypothetical protein CSB44_04825 [Gammaproteobacteria bacterium]PIE35453.1 MAG: hypothetical protein CSA54_05545 [Gammaproteobacteria bacterium]